MNDTQPSADAQTRASAAESCAKIAAELESLLHCLAPQGEAREHFRAAKLELLKGLRALIDARIQQLSSSRQKGTSVAVE